MMRKMLEINTVEDDQESTSEEELEDYLVIKRMQDVTEEELDFEALAKGDIVVQVVHIIPLPQVRKYIHLWQDSIKSEVVDGLEGKGAIVRFSGQAAMQMMREVGEHQYIPGKGVFTIKPPAKFKSRGVACGNRAEITGALVYAAGVESATLRMVFALSQQYGWSLLFTDVGTAFLNAELLLPYAVIVTAPQIFVASGVCTQGELWLVKRAIYGLRESPRAWGDHRDQALRQMAVYYRGMIYVLRRCSTDTSIWRVIKYPVFILKGLLPVSMRVLIHSFLGEETVGIILTYVDDILVSAFHELA